MSPVGAIFVPFPPKTGTNLLHPSPPPFVERVGEAFAAYRQQEVKSGADMHLMVVGEHLYVLLRTPYRRGVVSPYLV